jgi:glycerophosphoryl diester phosphodiesterase
MSADLTRTSTFLPAPPRVRPVELIAHRGESFDAPENTLAAFRLAWERGATAIELDTHLSRDGALVVCHDPDTARTTDVSKLIRESTVEELRPLDAGRWKGPRWAGERLPVLGEVLTTVPDDGRCLIEIKVGPEAVPALAEAVRASGLRPGQLTVISFHDETVAEVKRVLPALTVNLLSEFHRDPPTGLWTPSPSELVSLALSLGADGLGVSFHGPVDRSFVDLAHSHRLELNVWTVDDPSDARRLISAGVDSVTTNRAAWMSEELGMARHHAAG